MPLTADRCKETSTSTGTGSFTLNGAVAQFQSFASAFSVGSSVMYAIADQSGTDWEVGEGTLTSSSVLTRNTVRASSNLNTLVNFGSGTKDVFATITADYINTFVRNFSVEVDFGVISTGMASVIVSAPWVRSDFTKLIITPSGEETTDHSPEDYVLEGVYAIAANIQDGSGFTLIAGCKNTTFGKYLFNVVGV